MSGPPLYPFGDGLSYTRFALTDLKLSADTATVNSTLTVTVTLTNSGARAGSEVVQVYAKEPAGKVAKPLPQRQSTLYHALLHHRDFRRNLRVFHLMS